MISIFSLFWCALVVVLVEQIGSITVQFKLSSVSSDQYIKVHSDGNVTATGSHSGKDLSRYYIQVKYLSIPNVRILSIA